jgi:hypothetical protein
VTCDGTCQPMVRDKRGKLRPDGPRRYPLDRLCCAAGVQVRRYAAAAAAGLRVIAAQIGPNYAERVREAWRNAPQTRQKDKG